MLLISSQAFGQYVLLLSYFVPITLLVQLEVCRACQAGFLSADDHMLCPATEKKASVQSVALMEELGSVTHVFSDKTGTLTQNLMQFRCLAVGDTLHGFDEYQEMVCSPKELLFVLVIGCEEVTAHGRYLQIRSCIFCSRPYIVLAASCVSV